MNNSHYVSIKQSMVSITYVLHKSKQPSECLNVLCCASQSGHSQYTDPPIGRAGQSGVFLSVRFFIGLGFLLFLSVLFFYRFRFCFSYKSVFLPVSDIPNLSNCFFISFF